MAKQIRNLHEAEITTTGNDVEMGRRYLDATRLDDGSYIYRAPETGKNYLVHQTEIEALGRAIYAISEKTTEYLSGNEVKLYSSPDGEDELCDCGYAYSLWCSKYGEETEREIPE